MNGKNALRTLIKNQFARLAPTRARPIADVPAPTRARACTGGGACARDVSIPLTPTPFTHFGNKAAGQ